MASDAKVKQGNYFLGNPMKVLNEKKLQSTLGGTAMIVMFELPGVPRIYGLHLTSPVAVPVNSPEGLLNTIKEISDLAQKGPFFQYPPLPTHIVWG